MSYRIKEMFYSLQGEGARAGVPHVFVRFAGCNLDCSLVKGLRSPGTFQCDTDFQGGDAFELPDLVNAIKTLAPPQPDLTRVLLTGGEPGLQVDAALCEALHAEGWEIAIETNGMFPLCEEIDWVTVSPKMGPLRVYECDELKYVLQANQPLPTPPILARWHFVSPAWNADGTLDPDTMTWCINLVKENPDWRLSPQLHKMWHVR